jgi:hypothetical protein
MNVPSVPFETIDLEDRAKPLPRPDPDEEDLPGAASEPPTLVLRHLGGSLGEVDVLEATSDGCLHVRWRGAVGTAPYVLHVLRPWPPPPKKGAKGEVVAPPIAGHVELAVPTGVLLWKTNRAKAPLPWTAMDPEGAKRLWRRMTGTKD